MIDEQMLRYARHLMLEDFGFEGQEQLLNSRVLVLGMGGLGSPVAMYLAAAGVGTLIIADDDRVELSNLQRQIIHRNDAIGLSKVESAKQTLLSLNPDSQIEMIDYRLSEEEAATVIANVDLVLDCSDNYHTRHILNKLCLQARKPLVAAAAIRWEGIVTSFDFRQLHSPCYACMFDPEDNLGPDNCATLGVVSPLLGVMGSMQALEAIKLLIGARDTLVGKLAMFNAKTSQWKYLDIPKSSFCAVCG
ncbi:HesA/MoeB/ThiF family protein [Pelistega suis]|uniref:HesA/MoeB/ThiF family protein n=2 Tax=Bacteria TaxID=2 RepID=UPI00211C4931|nr:HesA/MoeB/ThiF family protein [Pelistega suis]MCQ9327900.1 HesA/MoeB/ThiF family protein [Pelistega suis]